MHFNTIVEVAKLIQSKQISPVELTQMQLERIRKWDPTLRSYATLMPEYAVDMAKQAEAEPTRPGAPSAKAAPAARWSWPE